MIKINQLYDVQSRLIINRSAYKTKTKKIEQIIKEVKDNVK